MQTDSIHTDSAYSGKQDYESRMFSNTSYLMRTRILRAFTLHHSTSEFQVFI